MEYPKINTEKHLVAMQGYLCESCETCKKENIECEDCICDAEIEVFKKYVEENKTELSKIFKNL